MSDDEAEGAIPVTNFSVMATENGALIGIRCEVVDPQSAIPETIELAVEAPEAMKLLLQLNALREKFGLMIPMPGARRKGLQ